MLSVTGGDTDLLASASAAWTRLFPPWVPHAFSSHGWGSPQLFTPQSWVPTAMCWRCSAVCMLPSPTSRRENELRGPGTPHPARPSLWWPRAGHLSPACAPAWPCRARDKRTFGAAALPTRAEASRAACGQERLPWSQLLGSKPQCPLPVPTPPEGGLCESSWSWSHLLRAGGATGGRRFQLAECGMRGFSMV